MLFQTQVAFENRFQFEIREFEISMGTSQEINQSKVIKQILIWTDSFEITWLVGETYGLAFMYYCFEPLPDDSPLNYLNSKQSCCQRCKATFIQLFCQSNALLSSTMRSCSTLTAQSYLRKKKRFFHQYPKKRLPEGRTSVTVLCSIILNSIIQYSLGGKNSIDQIFAVAV